MPMFVKDATVWKTSDPKVRDGGVWKQVQTGSVRDGGVWKVFFNNITYTSTVSSSSPNEGTNVTIYVYPSRPPSNTYLSYTVKAEYGSAWDTNDYFVQSPSNQKPSGPEAYWDGSAWYLVVQLVADGVADAPEYFSVDFFAGYSVFTNPVVTSPVVTVNNQAAPSCIWALYGRPEWC